MLAKNERCFSPYFPPIYNTFMTQNENFTYSVKTDNF